MKTFSDWLASRGVPRDGIDKLLELLPHSADLFETPERIMESDCWFNYPDNSRFVLLGSCPNGDAVAIDTADQPGAIFFIDHERVHDDIPDSERAARVANSLTDYVQSCLDDPDFPCDYHEAKNRA
jgi:hypothetical protein